MRLLVFLAALLASANAFAAGLRVAGSDLLGPDFEEALVAFARREKLPITTAFAGSRAGMDEVKSGAADLALAAFSPDEKLPESGFTIAPLAYRIAVVVVPNHIGATQISFDQLDGFFGANGPAGFAIWRDVGVTGRDSQLTVTTHLLADKAGGLTTDLFAHIALRVPKLKPAILYHDEFSALRSQLSSQAGGLAILPYVPPPSSGLKVLLVAKKDGEPAFGPSPENIHTGDYPLRLPIYIVFRPENAVKLRALLAFLVSEEASLALAKNTSLTTVPASGRAKFP